MSLILKWSVLVLLSAIASFVAAIFSEFNSIQSIFGMLLGICTFILVYLLLDKWLLNSNRKNWSESLKYSVYTKIALQLIPAFEVGAGAIADSTLDVVGRPEAPFLHAYIMTLLTGLFLSFVVAIIYTFVRFIAHLVRQQKIQ